LHLFSNIIVVVCCRRIAPLRPQNQYEQPTDILGRESEMELNYSSLGSMKIRVVFPKDFAQLVFVFLSNVLSTELILVFVANLLLDGPSLRSGVDTNNQYASTNVAPVV
jgi:hypothetical protein